MAESNIDGIALINVNCLNNGKEVGIRHSIYFYQNPIKGHFLTKNTLTIKIDLTYAPSKTRALEFGAGFGILLLILPSLYVSVVTIGTALRQIDNAAKFPIAASLTNVGLVPHPSVNEFEDKSKCSYNVVVVDNILEHVPSPEKMIFYFSKILKFDGIFILLPPTGYLNYRAIEISNNSHLIRTEVSVPHTYLFFEMCTYTLKYMGDGND